MVSAAIERQCYTAAQLKGLSREQKRAAVKNNETKGVRCN